MNPAFPFQFDDGHTALATDDDHVRQMVEELLFTAPGERVNRPELGAGLLRLIFAPNSPELATALQFQAKALLQRWLGDVIDLKDLQYTAEDSTLSILVSYVVRKTDQQQTLNITRPINT